MEREEGNDYELTVHCRDDVYAVQDGRVNRTRVERERYRHCGGGSDKRMDCPFYI